MLLSSSRKPSECREARSRIHSSVMLDCRVSIGQCVWGEGFHFLRMCVC